MGGPDHGLTITALEEVTGRRWKEMTANYGDPGRAALLAVATRHLGWRLSEAVREVPGLSYNAAAQDIRRIWARATREKETMAMITAIRKQLSHI